MYLPIYFKLSCYIISICADNYFKFKNCLVTAKCLGYYDKLRDSKTKVWVGSRAAENGKV